MEAGCTGNPLSYHDSGQDIPIFQVGYARQKRFIRMSHTTNEPIALAISQVNAAAQLLGSAFHDDPLMIYLIPDAARRARLLPSFYRFVARYCLRYGFVYTTPDLAGVVCCLPPGQTTLTAGRLLRISLQGAPVGIGLATLRRFMHFTVYADKAHEQAAPGPHWYLWALATEPEQQGRGLGGQLLQTVLHFAGTEQLPCYLETENPRNVPFYQHHGLRLVGDTTVAQTELHIYALLWEPGQV